LPANKKPPRLQLLFGFPVHITKPCKLVGKQMFSYIYFFGGFFGQSLSFSQAKPS